MNKKQGQALVVGAGISGIRSALDLAEAGCKVTLIDTAPHMGGVLAKLEHQFPTDGCGMCRMLPTSDRDNVFQGCLRKGLIHENVEVKLLTRLAKVEGEPGNLRATLETQAPIVDPDLCTGCNLCFEVCPVTIADPFNLGLSRTRAIHLPVPHAVPNIYTIDMDHCTLCGECEKVCPFDAITLPKDKKDSFSVLVVDDELILRESLKDWLEFEGFKVEIAASGKEALERLEANYFSMVLLDIKMPDMDGTEVLSRAKELYPELPVIMMTAYATVETAVGTMQTGALEYVVKPFDPEKIISLVTKVYLDQLPDYRRFEEIEVGAVVLATGVDYYDPTTGTNIFGYKTHKDVVTNAELERILSQTGPFGGELKRPSDGRVPQRMAWIQCVGSRQKDFPVCSSICCMIALKEAVLVRKLSRGTIETVVYFMDMRCSGKEFEDYRNRAENEYGVILKRARPHSVSPVEVPDLESGSGSNSVRLKLTVSEDSGKTVDELFDMVVLSVGQRPSAATADLVDATKLSLNSWGFLSPQILDESLDQGNKNGVFVAGSASGLKEIGESVIYSSWAANHALGAIRSATSTVPNSGLKDGPNTGDGTSPVVFRDVTREVPNIGVVVCNCPNLPDVEPQIAALVERDAHVSQVIKKDRICTRDGWDDLVHTLGESRFNRLVVVVCNPMFFIKKKSDLAAAMALDPVYIDFVGIEGDQPVVASVGMGLARLRHLARLNIRTLTMVPRVLVVGGGIGGMTAALGVARAGFEVVLVESSSKLGGNLAWLDKSIDGQDFQELLNITRDRIEKTSGITVLTNAVVDNTRGSVGRYSTVVRIRSAESNSRQLNSNNSNSEIQNSHDQKIDCKAPDELKEIFHGAVILATGGKEAKTTAYGYGTNPVVMTNREVEAALKQSSLDPGTINSVVIIQCVDSRETRGGARPYCSRICCASSLKHALELKRLNPELDIYVLYREIMTQGFTEAYYKEARDLGIIFIRYSVDGKPEVTFESDHAVVKVLDPILDRFLEIQADLVVLATGVVARQLEPLTDIFNAGVDQYSFFDEADPKWRPVDALTGGVFACGLALGPRSVEESIASAGAAAMGAVRLVSTCQATVSAVTAGIKQSLCSVCEQCIEACVFGARTLDSDTNQIRIDPVVCQGCGACASVCPNSASFVNNFLDQQMFEIIDAAV